VLLSQTMSNNNNKELNKEIEDCRRELFEYPSWLPDSRCQLLRDLSVALYNRFKRLGGHPNRSDSLNNLGSAVSTRFEQLGRMEDLEAITCYRQALSIRPDGHLYYRSASLINLASAVSNRFELEQSKSNDDLLDAVKYLSEARNILPTGHPLNL
jgi:hypothetical protein